MTTKITASVLGGSGYIGGEVVRILLGHPNVSITCITANEQAGKRLDEVQPNLRGFTDLRFEKYDGQKADVTFLSLPHGEAAALAPRLGGKIVDLSGDFRLSDRPAWEKHYKLPHPSWDLQKEFAYGIPEINREAIRRATRVAAGGCFATASILSNVPLVRAKLAAGPIVIDGKTGSSGSGAKPSEKTHHPFRAHSFFAYEPFHHRHTPEIRQALGGHEVLFQPHSAPMVRGVFTTSYVPLARPTTDDELLALFRRFYEGERFVRLGKGTPNVAHVAHSNFADIGVAASGTTAIVFAAIDNLVKGGAGQGVQCMNLMCGFEEDAGLNAPPAQP